MKSEGRSAARVPLILCALVAVLASVTSLGNDFAYDDQEIITNNPRVTDPAKMGTIWSSTYWSSRASGGLFRPLTIWTYAVQHRIHDLKPFGYHLVNVLLHALVSLLVFVVAFEYLGLLAAFLAGMLFAVHPVHTEAIANVVGRAELLAAAGFLLGWVLYPTRPGAGKWRGIAAAVAYLAALLSKENAVLLPAALLVRDAAARRRPHVATQILFGAALIVYLGWRYQVLGGLGNPKEMVIYRIDNVIASLPFAAARWTALDVIGRYVKLLVFPLRLSADYSYPQIDAAGAGSIWAWLGLLAVLAIVVHFVREGLNILRRRRAAVARGAGSRAADAPGIAIPGRRAQGISIGLAIFALTLLPVSNLLFPIGTVMAERLLYLPSVGFLIVLAAAAERVYSGIQAPAMRRAAVAFAAVVVLLGAARSAARSREWKNNDTIHAATVEGSPRSARARFNYGVTLHDKGRIDPAIAEVTKAVRLDSAYSEAWTNLGGYKMEQGRLDEARADLRMAIEVDSTWWAAHPNAALPGSAVALISLGGLEVMDHHPRAAVGYLEKAMKLAPNAVEGWFNLGLARSALGDTAGSIECYRRAVSLGTNDPDTYNNLAWSLAIAGGHDDEALRAAAKAVALRPDAGTYDTLAEVHFRAGRWREAREAWSKALSLGAPNAESIRLRLASMPGK